MLYGVGDEVELNAKGIAILNPEAKKLISVYIGKITGIYEDEGYMIKFEGFEPEIYYSESYLMPAGPLKTIEDCM